LKQFLTGERKMRIILLTGAPHSQKTTTLNDVYAQLTIGVSNPPLKQPIQYGSSNDFECIVPYRNTAGQMLNVAIFSLGDTLYRVQEAVVKYSLADVLILALNQNGNTKVAYAQRVQNCSQHKVVPKTGSNNTDCQTILGYI
jgi:hypothetical protein